MMKPLILSLAVLSATAALAWAQSGSGTHTQTPARTTTTTTTAARPAAPHVASTSAAHAQTPAAPRPAPAVASRDPRLAQAVPDAKGYHRMVMIRALDKITGRAQEIAVPAGRAVKFGTLSIVARYCHKVPPEEPPDTSAFLQIQELKPGEQPVSVFSGWMFATSPSINGLEHPVYDVWVISCITDEPAPPPAAAPVVTTFVARPAAPATVSGAPGTTPDESVEGLTPDAAPEEPTEEDVGVGTLPTH